MFEGTIERKNWTQIIDHRFRGGWANITGVTIHQKDKSGIKKWTWHLQSITNPEIVDKLPYTSTSVTLYDPLFTSQTKEPILLYVGDSGALNARGIWIRGADPRIAEEVAIAKSSAAFLNANVDFLIDATIDRVGKLNKQEREKERATSG